jgi:hypothetical protein
MVRALLAILVVVVVVVVKVELTVGGFRGRGG